MMSSPKGICLLQRSSVAQVFPWPSHKTLVLDHVPLGPGSLESEQKKLTHLALGYAREMGVRIQGRAGWRFQNIAE